MEVQRLFINSVGRLRSGWRLALFVLLYIALLFAVTSAMRVGYAVARSLAPGGSLGDNVEDVIFRLILLFASLGTGFICTRLIEGLPWRALGLALHPGWFRDFMAGSVIGIVSLALASAIARAAGGLHFSFFATGLFPLVAKTLASSAALFIIAALAEEALFRGYALQTFSRARLAWLGVLITSVPFAAVHLSNPNGGQALAFVNTSLAGVWLAEAYLRTRSLWFPLGIHWAWNWALGALFGLPVSGITRIAPYPLLQATDLGPAWLTGGSYGIEGGLACTIALVVSTIFIWRTRLVSASEEMKKLTSQENPARANLVVPILPQPNDGAAG